MRAKDLMIKNVPTLYTTHTILDALKCFTCIQSNMIPIVSKNDRLIGIVTKSKIIQALANDSSKKDIIEPFISYEPIYILPENLVSDTREILLAHQIGHAPVVNEDMKPIGVISTAQILFGYEKAYDLMNSRLSFLFNHLNFGLVSVNLTQIIQSINAFAQDMLTLTDSAHSTEQMIQNEEIIHILEKVLINKETEVKDTLSLNGLRIFIRCYPLFEKNKIVGAMLLMEDITELEKNVEELRLTKEWEERLRSVIELAYDGFIIVNKSGEITMMNDGFRELFNAKEQDLLGTSVKEAFPELAIHDVLDNHIKINNVAKLIGSTQSIVTVLPIQDRDELLGAVCKITYRGLKHLQEALTRVEKLEKQVSYYQQELQGRKGIKYSFNDIIGDSSAITKVKTEAYAAAQSISTVLLLGESGTGKELFASGIHAASRQTGKFIQINCAAIPADLLESELFGYDEGAFTGAKKGGKKGKLELAQSGTLFLDEIGDMPLLLQSKILRVLQEKEFEPIGGHRTIRLNTKIIAATNQDLQQLIVNEQFREDLYYRLNVMSLHIPPLRQRIEDIPEITETIIDRLNKSGFQIKGITHSALTKLLYYHWPGNIRELHNIIERAANLSVDGYIGTEHLPEVLSLQSEHKEDRAHLQLTNTPIEKNTTQTYYDIRNTQERNAILHALKETNGNKAAASRLLGISRTWLYAQIKKYGI